MINFLDHALLLNHSYKHWMGEYLLSESEPQDVLGALNSAEFAVMSHGQEEDPVFNYGNLAALKIMQLEFENLVQMPSRQSADESNQADRNALFEQVNKVGFIDDYQGQRVTSTGRTFFIKKAVVWNLIDPLGRIHGQAVKFEDWHYN